MKKSRWFWGMVFVLWLGFIWWHSLQPAEISSQQSGAVLSGLSALLERLHLPNVLDMFLVRKLAHMTEYGVLGLVSVQVCALWSRSWPGRIWNSVGLCLAAATVSEFGGLAKGLTKPMTV